MRKKRCAVCGDPATEAWSNRTVEATAQFYDPRFHDLYIIYLCGGHRIGARALRERQNIFLLAPLQRDKSRDG